MSDQETWDAAFEAAAKDDAVNTAPVEAICREVSYYLRARYKPSDYGKLHALDFGCGSGVNLMWLVRKGLMASGIDISHTAIELCKRRLERWLSLPEFDRVQGVIEGSVTKCPWPDESFDIICESNVVQHLPQVEREAAFDEIRRLLKPGGLLSMYVMGEESSLCRLGRGKEVPGDWSTWTFPPDRSGYHANNFLIHFFQEEEFISLLRGFKEIDPHRCVVQAPKEEAIRRGIEPYITVFWSVFAIK